MGSVIRNRKEQGKHLPSPTLNVTTSKMSSETCCGDMGAQGSHPHGTACSVITGLACSCLAPGSAEIQSEEGHVVIGERDGEAEEAEGGAEQGYGLSWGLTSARSQGKLRSVTLIPQC